jgi:Flp pilus assembly CpaF family ATPase
MPERLKPPFPAISTFCTRTMTSDLQGQELRQANNLAHCAAQLLPILAEPTTLDVVVNADGKLWVNRLGRGFEQQGHFRSSDAKLLLSGVATVRQIEFDHHHPILETIFPLTGDRIEGITWPIVPSTILAIRTRQKKLYSLDDLIASGIITDKADPLNARRHRDDFMERIGGKGHGDVIRAACRYRRNILLVGPTGSGKTTMANSIIAEWDQVDRVVMIEDTPELQCGAPNHVQLLATAHVSQAELLVATMRLIPKRIVVGEVREHLPAKTLLSAWNTGHSGGLATIHADDALQGLRKLETLIGGHSADVREQIATAVNVVIFIEGEESLPAGRKLREIAVVRGFNRDAADYAIDYV